MLAARRALAALLLCVGARARGQCGSDVEGIQTILPVQLPNVTLTPGVRDWNITIKDPFDPPLCPPQTEHVGTILVACDSDSPPAVSLDNLVRGAVSRTGSLRQPGVLLTILFCNFIYGSLSKSSAKVVKYNQGQTPRVSRESVPKTSVSGSTSSVLWSKTRAE